MTAEWVVWPREPNLSRVGNPIRWSKLTLIERYNRADTWILEGPASGLLPIAAPGMGCIIDRGDMQVTSGSVRIIERESDERGDTIRLGMMSDHAVLARRLCYPTPSHTITSTPAPMAEAYDVRSGPRETLLLAYIAANTGPAAPVAARRDARLLLPASLGRGGVSQYRARMDPLVDVVATLAEAGSLRVTVRHDETTGTPRLRLGVATVPDLSNQVIFGDLSTRANANIGSWSYAMEEPEATRVIVWAGGEQEQRLAGQYADTAAETLWGWKRETLIDQRQTADPVEMAEAGNEALEDGATPVSVQFSPGPSPSVKYRDQYDIGSRVGVELPGLPGEISDNVVREVQTTVDAEGEATEVVVGTPGARINSTATATRLGRALRRLGAIERST